VQLGSVSLQEIRRKDLFEGRNVSYGAKKTLEGLLRRHDLDCLNIVGRATAF